MKTEDKQKIREDIHGYLDRTMDRLEEKYDKVNFRVGEAREKTDRYIHDNPRKSLLMAVGAGVVAAIFAMGLMKHRRCRHGSC